MNRLILLIPAEFGIFATRLKLKADLSQCKTFYREKVKYKAI